MVPSALVRVIFSLGRLKDWNFSAFSRRSRAPPGLGLGIGANLQKSGNLSDSGIAGKGGIGRVLSIGIVAWASRPSRLFDFARDETPKPQIGSRHASRHIGIGRQ